MNSKISFSKAQSLSFTPFIDRIGCDNTELPSRVVIGMYVKHSENSKALNKYSFIIRELLLHCGANGQGENMFAARENLQSYLSFSK